MMFAPQRLSRIDVPVFGLGLLGLTIGFGCAHPTPSSAPNEIQLGAAQPPEPSPPPAVAREASKPKLKPCLVDSADGCSVDQSAPTVDASGRYSIPIGAADPRLGPNSAPVTVVIFSDYQCPFCARMKSIIESLRSDFPQEVRIVWKDLPLPMHEHAQLAALVGRAAYAAGGDAKFWEANQLIYDHQAEFSGSDGERVLQDLAGRLGLSWPPDPVHNQHLRVDWDLAEQLDVRATPTTFVNGRPITGAKDYSEYHDLVEAELGK